MTIDPPSPIASEFRIGTSFGMSFTSGSRLIASVIYQVQSSRKISLLIKRFIYEGRFMVLSTYVGDNKFYEIKLNRIFFVYIARRCLVLCRFLNSIQLRRWQHTRRRFPRHDYPRICFEKGSWGVRRKVSIGWIIICFENNSAATIRK